MKRTILHNCGFRRGLIGWVSLFVLSGWASAAELRVPATIDAGQSFSIAIAGSGKATFYLIGPDHVVKRDVTLGNDLQIQGDDVRAAGHYRAILCDSSCTSETFEVKAAQPAHLSFFLHPSRVPVSSPGSIDASAFVFDQYFNLVLNPTAVDFRIDPANGAGFSRPSTTRNGVTWMHLDSTPHEGPVHVTAGLDSEKKVQETRVIQQVAAEACKLQMKAVTGGKLVTFETDPVRDCSGNPLPDGTVVSFTMVDKAGKSTVDTPLKKGIAKTEFHVNGPATVSVACGVVLGNEVAVNGNPSGKL